MQAFSKEEYNEAFAAGFKSAMSEKSAGAWRDILNGLATVGKSIAGIPKDLMLYGSAAGVATGVAGQILHDQLTRESPEEELHRTIESMYASKRKELDDANWMRRVRDMRADLMTNRKKMSVEEYTSKYNALVEALNERKA